MKQRRRRTDRTPARGRDGFALLTVLFVLLAMLVLCAPYLMTARNADRASAQLADRAEVRIALDAAGRHGHAGLTGSHPAVDPTVYFDSAEELAVDNAFEADFLNANDANGLMWDVDAFDVAGRIDLNSASPHVVANMLRLTTRLSRPVKPGDRELSVQGSTGFPPKGFLWIGGEIVRYGELERSSVRECDRGLFTGEDKDGNTISEGPRPAAAHPAGEPVIDQRAFAPAIWRAVSADGEPRAFDTIEQVAAAGELAYAAIANETASPEAGDEPYAPLDAEAFLTLDALGSVYAGVRGGPVWQRAARLTSAIEGGVDQELTVDDPRWFNEGATVKISDGLTTEIAIVQRKVGFAGEIVLDRVLTEDFEAYRAEVSVLARRPVNLNTASPTVLETLFLNLQMRGRNSRITLDEARSLAALVTVSRPFTGHEDFLRRVVLPAAGIEKLPEDAPIVPASLAGGGVLIDTDDAEALYVNGLNANDGLLQFATMPYAYTTRDVYGMELRASVNAKSGALRVAAVRERVELIAPQRDLFYLFGRQEDFDEALRLGRNAPWWCSGPLATSRYDGVTVPPSRRWAHFGTLDGEPFVVPSGEDLATDAAPRTAEHVFASRGDDGFIQLWPARLADIDPIRGHVEHFDHETRELEGRYLPDETLRYLTSEAKVEWNSDSDALMRALSFSMWLRPRQVADSVFLDVGESSLETDRILLAIEEEDLVLRVLDGFGDHRDSELVEAGEARFAIAPGTGPGLPADTWSHVSVDVRGNRPDQITMLVNGTAHGVRTPGLTRLTEAAPQSGELLVVESTEGFPARGVVRVGNELVEYELLGGNVLRAIHEETGPFAGSGGRTARERFNLAFQDNLEFMDLDHSAGASVALYGYSLPIFSNLPAGGARLPSDLGPWRVARLVGTVGAGSDGGEPIFVNGDSYGLGMEGAQASQVQELVLALGDSPDGGDMTFMSAFNQEGGYAAIVQTLWFVGTYNESDSGTRLGGIEVIRYSGYSDNRLLIAARNPGCGELQNLATLEGNLAEFVARPADGQGRAFVYDWENTGNFQYGLWQPLMSFGCYVIPISIPAPGVTDLSGALPAEAGRSQFAQLTHVEDAELTEWVRYDEVSLQFEQLVRDDPESLLDALRMIRTDRVEADEQEELPGGGGEGDDPPKGFAFTASAGPAAPPPAPASAPPRRAGSDWDPVLGKGEDETPAQDYPLSRAVGDALRHRAVLGTFSHSHPEETPILPVFTARDPGGASGPDAGLDYGRPGRLDAVFVVGSEPSHLGWPLIVHRAHLPWGEVEAVTWTQIQGSGSVATASAPVTFDEDRFEWDGLIYIALQDECPEAMPAGGEAATSDSRLMTRLVKFPSGERPRVVSQLAVGTGFGGATTIGVPSAVVDEIVFGRPDFGRGVQGAASEFATQGGQLELEEAVAEDDDILRVTPDGIRIPWALARTSGSILDGLSPDGGLLRIGDEIVAYESRDPGSGEITLAVSGRGLLGTRAQPHEKSEPITYLEHIRASTLATDVGAGDATLTLVSNAGFPREGTVLVGSELIHYTRLRESAIEMPRSSVVPGAMDEQGAGIFRGRFGTQPSGHAAGEPVMVFPFRYWDRWAERADGPELGYFGLEFDQPSAWWRSLFWEWESAGSGGGDVGVLMRTDPSVPWDADPNLEEGLELMWDGTYEGKEIPIGAQSDRIEWRVFVRYAEGSFDAETGASHAWKETPRFRRLGVTFLAPSRVLRSVDR